MSVHLSFEPEDPEDASFHERFKGLRGFVIQVAHTLSDRIKEQVGGVQRTAPSLSDVLGAGLAELLNVLARLMGADPKDPPNE